MYIHSAHYVYTYPPLRIYVSAPTYIHTNQTIVSSTTNYSYSCEELYFHVFRCPVKQ